eukprot:2017449-Amphidinium_carterae.1
MPLSIEHLLPNNCNSINDLTHETTQDSKQGKQQNNSSHLRSQIAAAVENPFHVRLVNAHSSNSDTVTAVSNQVSNWHEGPSTFPQTLTCHEKGPGHKAALAP